MSVAILMNLKTAQDLRQLCLRLAKDRLSGNVLKHTIIEPHPAPIIILLKPHVVIKINREEGLILSLMYFCQNIFAFFLPLPTARTISAI